MQSIMSYPTLLAACGYVFPKMFKVVETWEKKKLPETIFSQIFFQRCATSKSMDWHQDPGENYKEQAHYSLILMLSDQGDPEHGWNGGMLKIKPGLPEDKHAESDSRTIIHQPNQGVLFNNQSNSHAVTEVTSRTSKTKRDLMIVMFHKTKRPALLEKAEVDE